MKQVEKKLANHAGGSNHVWMQYAEVRILAGSVKVCSNVVVGAIMPESPS
jgi:hypothetical protein